MIRMEAKATPTTIPSYESYRTYSTNHMGSISHHITPLVINSLRAHTHTHTHTNIHTDVSIETILRNQMHTNHRPAHSCF